MGGMGKQKIPLETNPIFSFKFKKWRNEGIPLKNKLGEWGKPLEINPIFSPNSKNGEKMGNRGNHRRSKCFCPIFSTKKWGNVRKNGEKNTIVVGDGLRHSKVVFINGVMLQVHSKVGWPIATFYSIKVLAEYELEWKN